jgi:hypothetical protein
VQIEMALMKLQGASKAEELLFWGKITGTVSQTLMLLI